MRHYFHNSLRALFLSLAVLLSLPMLAVEIEIDGINYDLNAEAKQATVKAKSSGKYSGEVIIPESVEHDGTACSVTSIGENAFANCFGLTSVTIPNSVTSIGENAFVNCKGLTSVTIPNSVTSIGEYAFYACSGLTSVTIPNSVTSMGDYAFNNCSGLTSVTIGNGVMSIGYAAFYGCDGLTSVTIPNSVTSIEESAFAACDGLTSVTIPNSVTSIGNYAFAGCPELHDVYCYAENVPSTASNTFESSPIQNAILHVPAGSVDSYKTAPWSGFGKIVAISTEVDGINYDFDADTKQATVIAKSSGKYSGEVIIPASVEYEGTSYSVTSIGENAFKECSDLTSVTIPNSVTGIGWRAFYYCSGLTSVTIPNSVTSIGKSAFSGCSGFTSVTIPNSVTSIGDQAFCRCSGLTSVTIPNSVTSIEQSTFLGCSGLTSVTIPNSVTSIGSDAFWGCSGLTSVTIGNGVKSIGYLAFQSCPELLDVYCYAENVPSTYSTAFDGSYLENATLYVPYASIDSYKATKPWSGFGKIVAITTEVDGINYDFDADTKQATVKEKSSGKYSGEIVIPESVEYNGSTYSVTSIGESAFYYCSGLSSVTIPNSVTSIGERAFAYCEGLTSVHISDIAAWCNIDFKENVSNPLYYANHLYLNGEEVKDLVIPNSVTSIGNCAFDGCSRLTSVTIPNSVTSIGDDAFSACSRLTSVHISDIAAWCNIEFEDFDSNPLYYAEHLYMNGEEVKDLVIPNSVTSIGDYAFHSCYGLTSVTIPNSVVSIGSSAFWGCSGLTSLTIPNSVTSIGERAFYSCDALTSVTIGNSVESIGGYAFYDCDGLTSVTIPNSVTSIGEEAFSSCSGLTSVTIGNSVESIGGYAFYGCNELHDVYCYAEDVPSTESYAFISWIIKDATLHVPAASIDSYKATAPWSGFGKIVAISESTSDLVIKDGESFENTEERELGTLTYTRTLPNRYWNPLYVPFKIPYEALKDNYDVAYINSMHSYDNDQNGEIDKMTMEVILVKNGVLKANHPYLIRAKSDNAKKMELVLEDVTLYPTVSNKLDCSSVYTRFEITGTYKAMSRDDLNGSLVITTSGAWMELSESSELKPFRFYLTITDRPGSPLEVSKESKSRINICVQGEDDFSTGIEEMENGKVKTTVYDLSGRRVQKAQKGIFIRDGKVVVR